MGAEPDSGLDCCIHFFSLSLPVHSILFGTVGILVWLVFLPCIIIYITFHNDEE